MPDLDHVEQLELLLDEVVGGLQVLHMRRGLACLLQFPVVHLRSLNTWEEVGDNVIEEREVVAQELWHVHISEGSEQDLRLALVRVLPLVEACSLDDRLHGAHAVVVVRLRGKLLAAKLERRDHLLGEVPAVLKSKGIERDLADQAVVWNHHRHWSEQCREIVRKLGAPSVAWIHRDERPDCPYQPDVLVHEQEGLHPGTDGIQHRFVLRGDH
mmetsp:Transcript_154847/g.495184  ORF Transcript_154847/g.495184 Transcript_154847/m.495184 type:complete len:213 (+) Transcript_154847:2404-3042(+)